jgi:hypothetical protein
VDENFREARVRLGLRNFLSRRPKKEIIPRRTAGRIDNIERYDALRMTGMSGMYGDMYIPEIDTRDIVFTHTAGEEYTFPQWSVKRSVIDAVCWQEHRARDCRETAGSGHSGHSGNAPPIYTVSLCERHLGMGEPAARWIQRLRAHFYLFISYFPTVCPS